jgi:hypothetical protein
MATSAPEIESNHPPPGGGVHKTLNRWLTTVALVLSIVILAAIIFGGVRLIAAASDITDRLSELGSSSETTGVSEELPSYLDPNAGYPGDPGLEGYIGPTNPDGSPCVGYGCTPEMDAEIDAGERAANEESTTGNLEQRCSDGTATVEDCFGPGSDENGNGIADVNE